MIQLHYVGFNGYRQFPSEENCLKIIKNWTCFRDNNILNVSCSHKTVCIETRDFFKVFGISDLNNKTNYKLIEKPAIIDNFKVFDDFLIANSDTCLWNFKFDNVRWEKLNLEFLNSEEEYEWNKCNNKIVKYSFREDSGNIILLLGNGSVWMLKKNKITLFFRCNVERVVDVTSGLEHTLFLTESGCVLSYGNGSRGQLGNGDLNSTSRPFQISALEGLKVIKIEAGGWHSCAITDSGDLYTWGWNNCGQLAAFDDNEEIGLTALPNFVQVGEDSETRVVDIACGLRHTVAILENGDLYSTGWNYYSQLGVESELENISRFSKSKIKISKSGKIICGSWFTIVLDGNTTE